MATDTAIPGKKPERTNSRKRVRRKQPQPVSGDQRRQQINAYYDLKKNSPALKAARMNRMKRLNAAKWAAAQAQIPVQWRAVMVVFRVIIMSLVLFVLFRVMLQEKQLLAIRNVLTLKGSGTLHQSKMSWHSFQHAYETHFQRIPTEGFKAWLDFAQQESCEPFKLYVAIERDLLPFRRQLHANSNGNTNPTESAESTPETATSETASDKNHLLNWKELEPIATNYTAGAFLLVEIRDNTITIIDKELDAWFDQHPTSDGSGWRGYWEERKLQYNLEWLLDPVVKHKPPITTRFVINLHQRPKSPPDAQVPIFGFHHEHHHTDADPTHPGNLSLEIANKNRNGIIDPRDTTTRDLLLPHLWQAGGRMGAAGMTSSPGIGGFWFWPFFRQGKPWMKRQRAIAWRGSTLGNYQKNVTGLDFFKGPRFDMMKLWSGGGGNDNGNKNGVHPIADNVNVDVDFAFTKLLIQGEEHMTKKQKEIIQNEAYQEYRFASRMSYGRMQQFQYLMDVDGNAFSVRFSALLRTGSLVFKSTRYREWYSERVRAWKDYIPVNHDASGLAEKLMWTSSQEQEVITNIIRHGKETVERHMRPEDMQCYAYRMMLEYEQLFDPASIPMETPAKRHLRDG